MTVDWQESTLHREWPLPSPLSKTFDDLITKGVLHDHNSRPKHTSGLGTSPYSSAPLDSDEEIAQLEQRTTFPTGKISP